MVVDLAEFTAEGKLVLSIDFSRCPERFYPLDYIEHDYTVRDIEGGGHLDWHRLELWYDFAEECPDIVSIR